MHTANAAGASMKLRVTFDHTEELPMGALTSSEIELKSNLLEQFEVRRLIIRSADSYRLSIHGCDKGVKKSWLRNSSSRTGKVQTTVFIDTACN